MFIGMPLTAMIFWVETAGGRGNALGSAIVSVLTMAYVFAVAVAVVRARGHRLALTALVLFFGWANAGSIIVASMAVSGDWM
jgi:hypothetical protein